MIEAKVILDSVSPAGVRLTTIEARIHRFILAELNTHRALSKNSSSSRARPVNKVIDEVLTDPALPIFWGKNQKGMSARGEILTLEEQKLAESMWLKARDQAVYYARGLMQLGLHKQLVNRLLEPFLWHTVIISSTDWQNFFYQRIHPDAQPEMKQAAREINRVYLQSRPEVVLYNNWHLPYISQEERQEYPIDDLKKISTGRCARVSYLTHDNKRDPREDIALHNKLAGANPMHASPFEHIATPVINNNNNTHKGNFRGWKQYRHEFLQESVKG